MRRNSAFCLALFLGALVLLLSFGSATPPAQAQSQADWAIPNGRFFTQTGGGTGRGYSVTDEGGIPFWTEFQRLGGVNAVGYPASQRFMWNGFVSQVFQRVVFQWQPETRQVYFVNVFDQLGEMGADAWLRDARQVPPARQWNEAGLSWNEIMRRRLATLDAYPAIRTAYYGVVGDAVQANGLPTSDVVDMGNHYALRAQRVAFQQWKVDVPWARAGQVTVALGGDIAKEAGLLPDQGALQPVAPPTGQAPAPQPPAQPTPTQAPVAAQRQVLGYYVPYDSSSWESLQRNASRLDYVALQWVSVDACGNIGSREDETLKRFARERGLRMLPSLLTSSGWLNGQLLNNATSRQRAIDQIVAYVVEEGYAGFDLDLESVNASDRAAYTNFVAQLGSALRARGKILTLAVPAKSRDVTTGWAGAYDYAAIGRHADLITIMTYLYHGTWGGPGSIAPQDQVAQAAAFATSQIPAHKVLLGVGFYGYDWNVTTGYPIRSLTYDQAQWLSQRYNVPMTQDPATRSATFRYQAPAGAQWPTRTIAGPPNQIRERARPACSLTPAPGPPAPTATPRPTPPPDAIQQHVVWYEDSASIAARLELANQYRTGGIGAWRLGQEEPRVWDVLGSWRAGR